MSATDIDPAMPVREELVRIGVHRPRLALRLHEVIQDDLPIQAAAAVDALSEMDLPEDLAEDVTAVRALLEQIAGRGDAA